MKAKHFSVLIVSFCFCFLLNSYASYNNDGGSTLKSKKNKYDLNVKQSWQGIGKYPGIDTYKDITIKQDKIIYRGEPNGTEYFTTKSAIERSRYDANTIFEGL